MQNHKIPNIAFASLAALLISAGSFAGYGWWRSEQRNQTVQKATAATMRALQSQDKSDFVGANQALDEAFAMLDQAQLSHELINTQLKWIASGVVQKAAGTPGLDKEQIHQLSLILQKTMPWLEKAQPPMQELHNDTVAALIMAKDGQLNNSAWGPEFDGAEQYAKKALGLADSLNRYNDGNYLQAATALRMVADRHFGVAMMCDKDSDLERHFKLSMDLAQQAVDAHHKMKSPSDAQEYCEALYRLGMAEKLFGNYEPAAAHLEQALKMRDAGAQRYAELQIDLAGIYMKNSRWKEAAALMKDVMAKYDRKEIILDNPITIIDMCIKCSEKVGDFDRAKTLKTLNERLKVEKAEEILR